MNNIEEDISKCKKCNSENLSLTLETPNGYRYKCNECGDTFVSETKLTGENIKDMTLKSESEIDGRKTIKIPKKSYDQLEIIRQEIGFTTIMDTLVHVIYMYKRNTELQSQLLEFLNGFGENLTQVWSNFFTDLKETQQKIQEQQKSEEKDNVVHHF